MKYFQKKLSTIFRLHQLFPKNYPLYSDYMKYSPTKLSTIFRLHEVLQKVCTIFRLHEVFPKKIIHHTSFTAAGQDNFFVETADT